MPPKPRASLRQKLAKAAAAAAAAVAVPQCLIWWSSFFYKRSGKKHLTEVYQLMLKAPLQLCVLHARLVNTQAMILSDCRMP